MYIFIIEFCISCYNFCDLRWGYLTHRVAWLIDHVIMWYAKKALSPLWLGQWPPILARYNLIWVDDNYRVTRFIYHEITLYSQKGASPVSRRQWPLNLVGLWVTLKGPNLFFQVTCRSGDHVLFEKRNVSTNARPQNSGGDIKHRKTHKSKSFCYSKDIEIWYTSIYTTLKISRLCR